MKMILKQKINNNQKVLGCFINIYSPALIEVAGNAGFDFIIIDNEHGVFSDPEIEHMLRAAESMNISPIIRVSYDPSAIQKSLDMGAHGIQVPMVNSKTDAEKIVRMASFPPIGTRGASFSTRASGYGKYRGTKFLKESNENILIAIQIETREAVDNLTEIINVPGIDLVFIGSTDLSVDIGYLDEGPKHPEIQKLIKKVYKKGKQNKIPIGTVAKNAEAANEQISIGANYIAFTSMSLISDSFTNTVNDIKINNDWHH